MPADVIEFPGERERMERELRARMEAAIDAVCASKGISRDDFLKFAVAYLSRSSSADRAALVAALPLSRFERRVFDALDRKFGKWVHVAELTDAVYWDDPSGGPANPSATLGNFCSRLRRKLIGVGLTIDFHPGGAGRRLIWIEQR